MYSDASSFGWGFKVKTTSPNNGLQFSAQGKFSPIEKELIIAQQEAIAWKKAATKTLELAESGKIIIKPQFLIDSRPLVCAILKGSSSDEFINNVIGDINEKFCSTGLIYNVKWISTDHMRLAGADKLSRFENDDEIPLPVKFTERGVRWLNRYCGPFTYTVFSSVYDNCQQFNNRYASFHAAEDEKFLNYDPFEFISNRKFSKKLIIFPPPELANVTTNLILQKNELGYVTNIEFVCVLPESNIRRLFLHFQNKDNFQANIQSFHVPNVLPKFKLPTPKPNIPWYIIYI